MQRPIYMVATEEASWYWGKPIYQLLPTKAGLVLKSGLPIGAYPMAVYANGYKVTEEYQSQSKDE
jgi:hypothetical protein